VRAEHVFIVDGSEAVPAEALTLEEAGLRERKDLQEWVLAYPEILGAGLKVITPEFDRWITGRGEADSDRPDVLAIDEAGRLVVAELKRGRAPNGVLNQVLNYAARVSRFSLDQVDEAHARYLDVPVEQATSQLRSFAPGMSDETLGPPALVVLASDYPAAVTNTALYLIEYDLPLTLLQFALYRTAGGELLLTTSQLLPVPNADEMMVRPRSAPATRAAAHEGREAQTRLDRLLSSPAMPDGQPLTVVVPPQVTNVDLAAVTAWLDRDPVRRRALWRRDPQWPIEWLFNGQRYTMPGFVRALVAAATEREPAGKVWGPNWLSNDHDGRNLVWHSDKERL
jgi:hypothetical protein